MALSVAAAACGIGPGDSDSGTATLRVTRDYGAELMVEASVSDPTEADTVIRLLDREAETETRFGGGFVQSIEGVSGGVEAGRSVDWFFYVNGIESSAGAAEVQVRAGDRIWWDHRDWTDAMRVPAVVGSWPEPFAQDSAGADIAPVSVECATDRTVCGDAAERLAEEGVDASTGKRDPAGANADGLRMIVGEWSRVRRDPAARLLDAGPSASGVFAGFEPNAGAGWALSGLDVSADPVRRWGPGAGLVAAVRVGEKPPTWLVTGADEAGTAAAVEGLSPEVLRDRYAVVMSNGKATSMPVGATG